MDPPGNVAGSKRRRKANQLVAAPFQEGCLKRLVSTKTPNSHVTLTSTENSGVSFNQGRWTCYEHYKFLEALKKFGKEWQKVQQHVNTRTSTQARSHAQKFFVKLDKKALTLEEFLKDLDLKEVEKTLLASGMDNTDYDEEREVNMVANRKNRGSVMNIALPPIGTLVEESKTNNVTRCEAGKRKRSEYDNYVRPEFTREQSMNNIRKAFEQHANDDINSGNCRNNKRLKISEKDDKGFEHYQEEKPCSEVTAITSRSKLKETEEDTPYRKLSISNFEPIQPSNMLKSKSTSHKDTYHIFGTPQPNRSENMVINQLVFK
jgi:SHAQKYF class myb-like DNA-binding protein